MRFVTRCLKGEDGEQDVAADGLLTVEERLVPAADHLVAALSRRHRTDTIEGRSVIQAMIYIVASDKIRGEALEVLRCLKEPTKVQKGCHRCRILQDVDDRNALTCVERWENLEDLEDYIQSERFRSLLPYIEMSVEPPEVEVDLLHRIHGIEFLERTLAGGSLPNQSPKG